MSELCCVCHQPLPEGELHRLESVWGPMCRSLLRCGPPPGQHWRDRQSRPDMVVRSAAGSAPHDHCCPRARRQQWPAPLDLEPDTTADATGGCGVCEDITWLRSTGETDSAIAARLGYTNPHTITDHLRRHTQGETA